MKKTRHEVVHEYQLTEGEWPDLQDSSQERRYVVRPRKVKIYQVPGRDLVRGVVIEGRQVRKDGGLNRRSAGQICVGYNRWYDAEPPPQLDELIEAEGLVWLTDRETPAP
jgi:hypothetical protein